MENIYGLSESCGLEDSFDIFVKEKKQTKKQGCMLSNCV